MPDISITLSEADRLTIKTASEIAIKHGHCDGGAWPAMRLAFQILPVIQKIEQAEVEANKPKPPPETTETKPE